jgi:flagellar basal-body rod protein FlgF
MSAMRRRSAKKLAGLAMETSSFVALSKQAAIQHHRLTSLANNIANASTPGYRKNGMNFATFLSRQTTTSPIIYTVEHPAFVNLVAGTITQTANPLDLAISDNDRAFFVVLPQAEGRPMLTRAGTFHLDGTGRVVTPNGDPLLGVNDQPIIMPGIDPKISVSSSGEVLEGDQVVGQIKILELSPGAAVNHRGRGLYESPATRPAAGFVVHQGALEGSNVEVVSEMTELIQLTRNYEMLQQLLSTEHARLTDLIDKMPMV